MNELKKMCESWQNLEEQKSQNVVDTAKSDEHVVRLMQDKVKLDTKIGLIMKQNTLCNNNMVNTNDSIVIVDRFEKTQ